MWRCNCFIVLAGTHAHVLLECLTHDQTLTTSGVSFLYLPRAIKALSFYYYRLHPYHFRCQDATAVKAESTWLHLGSSSTPSNCHCSTPSQPALPSSMATFGFLCAVVFIVPWRSPCRIRCPCLDWQLIKRFPWREKAIWPWEIYRET